MKLLRGNKEILIMFFITLASRVFLVLTARGIATDGCIYGWFAKEIANGNFHEVISSILPPLFPALTAVASYIFRDIEFSGRIISCLSSSLTVFPLFFLVKSVFDKKTALATVLFFIVHPYLSQASGEVLTEALYFFILTSIISLCWIAIQKRNSLYFSVVGLLLFLASLTRAEGITLIFLVLGWVWLVNLSQIKTEICWKLMSSFFCLVAFITAFLFYFLFVYQETGKLQVSPRFEQSASVIFKSTDDDRTNIQKVGSYLRYKVTTNVPSIPFFLTKAYHPVFLLFLFFGVIKRKRFRGFRIGEAYILSFILLRITILVTFAGITERYFYAIVPVALCWAGAGFWEIDYRLQERFKDKTFSMGGSEISRFSAIILIVVMAICLPRGLRPIRGHRAIQREAGYWLKENVEQGEYIIVAPAPQETFYAGAKWYKLEDKTYAEVINNARQRKADFIITDKDIDKICPDFRDSVDANDLEVFTRKFEKSNKKIVIYKLKK